MNDDLVELLRAATVAVVNQYGVLRGSGFFIAPGTVLTAAHVIDRLDGEEAHVRWGDTGAHPASVRWSDPERPTAYVDIYPLPDLAVLHVPAAITTTHACVMLSTKRPSEGAELLAQGYTGGLTTTEATPNPVGLRYDGPVTEPGGELLKCRGNVVEDGMSGGPLLDLATGHVVGVVKSQRSPDLPNGLYAVAARSLHERRPDIWTTNQLFHQSDRRWRLAIQPDSTVRDPATAARDLLTVTSTTVRSRALSLPRSVDPAAVHQTIWVRQVSIIAKDAGGRSVGERFRWNPLHQVGTTTVVRGFPGYGKTWLLTHYAATIAEDSRVALESGTDPDQIRIPVLVDCAALGARLANDPDRTAVLGAITGLLRLDRLPVEAAADCTAMVREAYDTGRLAICLDGLDEVPGEFRTNLKNALSTIAASSNTMLITTRPSTLSLLDDVALDGRVDVEMLGFGRRERSRFVAAWLKSRSEPLETALQNNESLQDMATVPLLLSFLCRLADTPSRAEGFPTSRTALYQQVVRRLLSGSWREPSRAAVDDISPPDPNRRMQVLAGALGELQDSWRTSGVTIDRGDLLAALSRQDGYEYVRTASIARWEAWQRGSNAEPAPPRADVVLWEYRFDGILVDEDADGLQPEVRVLHPSLRDFLLASYVSRLRHDELDAALARHRWFDPEWQEIFAIATPLLAHPDAMITRILDVQDDPWFTQALFAAQCVAESGNRISPGIVDTVIDALLAADDSGHPSDSTSAASALGRMVRAAVRPAETSALAICTGDTATSVEMRVEAACALAERRDRQGIHHAIALLSDRENTPRRYRRRLTAALATTEDPAAMDAILGELSSRAKLKDLDVVITALTPQSARVFDLAVKVLNWQAMTDTARAHVATALIECGDDAIDTVLAGARNPSFERSLRCQLYHQLINAGRRGLGDEAMALLRTPNLTADDKSHVVEAMVRQGDTAWLTMAVQLVVDPALTWHRRMALARAVRDIGGIGADLLMRQVLNGRSLATMLAPLTALVEVRHRTAQALAADIMRDEGVPAVQRAMMLLALLDSEESLVTAEPALSLCVDTRLTVADRMRVAVALARSGVADVRDAVRTIIADHADLIEWPLNSRLFAAAGHIGRAVLIDTARDEECPWDIRIGSLVALGGIQDPEVERTILTIDLDGVPEIWHNRLILGLTASGSRRYVERLVDSLAGFEGGYEALRQFMYGPGATIDDFFAMRAAVVAATQRQQKSSSMVAIDDDLLTSLELTWSSDTERRLLGQWVYETLEFRVGMRLRSLMLPGQTAEFEEFVDDEEEQEALRWLMETLPEHGVFVRHELELIKAEIRGGLLRPPAPDPVDDRVLANMATALHMLREWMRFSAAGQWSKFFDFAEANKKVLLTTYAEGVAELAARLSRSWPEYEAHLYVLDEAESMTFGWVERTSLQPELLRERLVRLLDHGQFRMLYLGGSWAEYRYRRSAHFVFYAALGAAGWKQVSIAKSLMELSGRYAEGDQVAQGIRTIEETGVRFEWPDETVTELQEALRQGRRNGE
ncbi:trypsin-like peptidase domain-containing protein [Actinosynnema sp. NPDC050801]|uniref:trypsin-like peptidase domain-containing protein n=1 Tax=unclassified Actinosynnema TaxID=2637065 RepID=UPI0033FC9620